MFLDDLWIGEQHKLTRPRHPADVYPEPVLCAEKLWEETSVSVATVMKTDDHWKKYYGARHATHGRGVFWEDGMGEIGGTEAADVVESGTSPLTRSPLGSAQKGSPSRPVLDIPDGRGGGVHEPFCGHSGPHPSLGGQSTSRADRLYMR